MRLAHGVAAAEPDVMMRWRARRISDAHLITLEIKIGRFDREQESPVSFAPGVRIRRFDILSKIWVSCKKGSGR